MREQESPKRRIRLLLVEDEIHLAEPTLDLLRLEGHQVEWARTLAEARTRLQEGDPELVLLDLELPDGSGLDLLAELPDPPDGPTLLVLTADGSAETAVRALRGGAHDYLTKPFDIEALLHRMGLAAAHHRAASDRALQDRIRRLGRLGRRSGPVPEHRSSAMARLYDEVRRMAAHDLPVLVRGETGAGKEHVSRLLHELSPRASQPFVAINCGELERHLLRSELFGHEKGAFTGADHLHRGLFELGGEGTLMLDEVAEMPMDAQASLLRVLESNRFRRVGGSAELRSRVRIVAATNKDLRQRVQEGHFREDLYFRLVAVELRVPPLRERPEDIPLLAAEFARRVAARLGEEACLDNGALARLVAYGWPGNVRELRNVVERSVLIHGGGKLGAGQISLGPDQGWSEGERPSGAPAGTRAETGGEVAGTSALFETSPLEILPLEEVEKRYIRRVLATVNGNRSRASRRLGIARSTLLRKLERWDQEPTLREAPPEAPERVPGETGSGWGDCPVSGQ